MGFAFLAAALASVICSRPYDGSLDKIGLAEVVGIGPTHFVQSGNGCPDDDLTCRPTGCPNNTASCADHSYVMPGDKLVVAGTVAGFTCATFKSVKTETSGWLSTGRLHTASVTSSPALTAWAGDWHSLGDNHIRLTPLRSGHLRVDGGAYWPSRNPGPDRPGGPNFGQLSGESIPNGTTAEYTEGDSHSYSCQVTLRLLGPYLVVHDNNHCGGNNVSFSGVYRVERKPS